MIILRSTSDVTTVRFYFAHNVTITNIALTWVHPLPKRKISYRSTREKEFARSAMKERVQSTALSVKSFCVWHAIIDYTKKQLGESTLGRLTKLVLHWRSHLSAEARDRVWKSLLHRLQTVSLQEKIHLRMISVTLHSNNMKNHLVNPVLNF